MDVKYKRWASSILLFSYCALLIFLLYKKQEILAFVIFYIPFIFFVVKNIKFIFGRIYRFIGTIFFTGGIYYVCRILAEKYINGTFGVDKEFINYSASIYGFLMTIPVSIIATSLFFILAHGIKSFYYYVASYFTEKYSDEYHSISFNLRMFVIFGYMFLSFPILKAMSYAEGYYILLDSYSYSDCNGYSTKGKNIFFLRQNENSCLKIQFNGFYKSPEYQSIPSHITNDVSTVLDFCSEAD